MSHTYLILTSRQKIKTQNVRFIKIKNISIYAIKSTSKHEFDYVLLRKVVSKQSSKAI